MKKVATAIAIATGCIAIATAAFNAMPRYTPIEKYKKLKTSADKAHLEIAGNLAEQQVDYYQEQLWRQQAATRGLQREGEPVPEDYIMYEELLKKKLDAARLRRERNFKQQDRIRVKDR